jgi:hypothetical protein
MQDQVQLQQKAQELAALEAARLREMTRNLRPTITIDTTNTHTPSNEEEFWETIGTMVLNESMPYSHLQKWTTISYVISHTFGLPLTEEWEPLLTELQLRSAELLFDFGCYMMSIATAKEVLKRHPDNTRAGRVVKDVRALSQ